MRVIVPYVGGGYGGKVHPRLEPLTAALARQAHRPVQWVLTREEVFLTAHCHASVVKIKTGVKRDGTLVARQVEGIYDTGAYALTGPSTTKNGGEVAGGPYRIAHQDLTTYCVYTNTQTSLAQIVAEELGISPERVSVTFPDTDVTPFDQPTSSSRTVFTMGGAARQGPSRYAGSYWR